jgi:hypothetical protein
VEICSRSAKVVARGLESCHRMPPQFFFRNCGVSLAAFHLKFSGCLPTVLCSAASGVAALAKPVVKTLLGTAGSFGFGRGFGRAEDALCLAAFHTFG